MPDIQSKCYDCGADFVITESEQAFFKSKDFSLPKRCKSCRDKRKAERMGEERR